MVRGQWSVVGQRDAAPRGKAEHARHLDRRTTARAADDPLATATDLTTDTTIQTWNELPHPQLLTTLGLLNTKPRFSRPS